MLSVVRCFAKELQLANFEADECWIAVLGPKPLFLIDVAALGVLALLVLLVKLRLLGLVLGPKVFEG